MCVFLARHKLDRFEKGLVQILIAAVGVAFSLALTMGASLAAYPAALMQEWLSLYWSGSAEVFRSA